MTCFSWHCVMLTSIIGPEMHIKTISSISSDISMHQKCHTGWIYELAGYFLSKDQIFTCTRFSRPFDLCSPYLNTNLHNNYLNDRVLKYEHFEGYFLFYDLYCNGFCFPKERRWAWLMTSFSQLLPGYQKSTQTFCMCHIVYFNSMKRNLGHLSCTRGLP